MSTRALHFGPCSNQFNNNDLDSIIIIIIAIVADCIGPRSDVPFVVEQHEVGGPAPIPSCYLTSSPRNASSHLAHHQQPHNTSSPNPNLPSLPLLSPTYPNSFQCPPYFHDLTLRLSPQPRPFDDLNATTLTPPPHPYPNHQLTTLHNICDRYPHINYSYLFMQYAPLSYVLSHTPKP